MSDSTEFNRLTAAIGLIESFRFLGKSSGSRRPLEELARDELARLEAVELVEEEAEEAEMVEAPVEAEEVVEVEAPVEAVEEEEAVEAVEAVEAEAPVEAVEAVERLPGPAGALANLALLKAPILVWDTETTGLHNPHIIQLAYSLLWPDGTVRRTSAYLKLLPGVHIDPRARAVHGISAATLEREGQEPNTVLNCFFSVINLVRARNGRMVAHNAQFDLKALRITAEAAGLYVNDMDEYCFCTLQMSKHHSPLLTANGRQKAFKLNEMYKHLHGEEPTWAKLHDAMADVDVLSHCVLRGVEVGWWVF